MFTNDFSEEVWASTYKHHADKSVNETLRRVAAAIASVENEDKKKPLEDAFFDMLCGFKVTTGGRIYANAGTGWNTTLMNCFVGPKSKRDQDSLDGILSVLRSQCQTLKSEGGWGMSFSFIRPRGSFIKGIGVESPGSVKYMEVFDKTSDVITAGSGKKSTNKEAKQKIRKGAMMGVQNVWHPDIEEFITAKLTPNRLSKFNLSVNCSNEFMDKVAKLESLKKEVHELADDSPEYEARLVELGFEIIETDTWDLIFPDTTHERYKEEWDGNIELWKSKGYPVVVHKTIKVSYLWELIMRSTYERNDPGVLFLDRANESHCWNYGKDSYIQATNPCGEQCLPFGGVCNLGSINLTQFIKGESFDLESVSKYTRLLVRFLDNVNSYTKAPLPEYEEAITRRRRIGIGVMGWGSALYMLKTRFASDKAEKIKAELMQCITHSAVEESIELAIEKGMFPDCDPVKHSQSKFFKDIGLPQKLIDKIAKYGIRNSALFSIQPTGNTSIFANLVSGGLEPVFMPSYVRTSIVNVVPDDLAPFCPKYWEGETKETSVFKFTTEGSEQILRGVFNGVTYKIDKNRGLTKETVCKDYGVSHLEALNEWDEKADWAVTTSTLTVEEHIKDMEGFGKWIDSSMSKTVNVPNDYPYESFKSLYINAYRSGLLKGITTYRAGTMTTVLAAIDSNAKQDAVEAIPKTVAPKRPSSLNAELHHISVNKQRYYVGVGLLGEGVYEIFTGINSDPDGEIYIPKTVKTGKIEKKSRGHYLFISDGAEYKLNNGHSDEIADSLTRLVSCSLRHGAPLNFIIEQLQKAHGPMTTFSKVLARCLKKYVKDGTESSSQCSDCGGKLIYVEGCQRCTDCGVSKCS